MLLRTKLEINQPRLSNITKDFYEDSQENAYTLSSVSTIVHMCETVCNLE